MPAPLEREPMMMGPGGPMHSPMSGGMSPMGPCGPMSGPMPGPMHGGILSRTKT